MQPIQSYEVKTPHLDIAQRSALLMSLAFDQQGGNVWGALTYDNQTDSTPRKPGADFVEVPQIPHDLHIGRVTVHRKVDNPKNRRDGTVGKVYLRVQSYTRGDGASPTGWVAMRPEGLTSFKITGFRLAQPEEKPEEVAQ